MPRFISFFSLVLLTATSFAQVKIHSHNDYEQQKPFLTAYQHRVFEIEADVFLVADSLKVSHSKSTLQQAKTLNQLYLDPIAALFAKYDGKVWPTRDLPFALMIDVKENWNEVYPILKREINRYGSVFKKNDSKFAIQIIISGKRPHESSFHSYPKWLYFDGLPNIKYNKSDFSRVALISDNFKNYSSWNGVGDILPADKAKLQQAVKQANEKGKLFRFWGAPDTSACWQLLNSMGKVVINTDKIEECKTYFENNK